MHAGFILPKLITTQKTARENVIVLNARKTIRMNEWYKKQGHKTALQIENDADREKIRKKGSWETNDQKLVKKNYQQSLKQDKIRH